MSSPALPRPLPAPLRAQVRALLSDRYRPWLRPGERADLVGSLDEEELEVTVFVERGEGEERWEATVRLQLRDRVEEEVLALALDAADAALAEWLEEDRATRPPPEFEEANYQGETLGLRRRRRSPALEAAAEKLLEKS